MDIVIKNDSNNYIMESKVIEKKYRRDIVKNKKRLNIKKELIKLDISTFNKIDTNNSTDSPEHLINKGTELTVLNTSFNSNEYITSESNINSLRLKQVKINPTPTEINPTRISSGYRKPISIDNPILLSKKNSPNIIFMTEL